MLHKAFFISYVARIRWDLLSAIADLSPKLFERVLHFLEDEDLVTLADVSELEPSLVAILEGFRF